MASNAGGGRHHSDDHPALRLPQGAAQRVHQGTQVGGAPACDTQAGRVGSAAGEEAGNSYKTRRKGSLSRRCCILDGRSVPLRVLTFWPCALARWPAQLPALSAVTQAHLGMGPLALQAALFLLGQACQSLLQAGLIREAQHVLMPWGVGTPALGPP